MTQAKSTQGTTVSIGDGASPEVFTPIAEVQVIPPIGGTKPEIDVSHLTSTAREYLPGLADGGEFQMAGNRVFNDPGQDALIAAEASGDQLNYRIVWNGDAQLTTGFAAIVKSFTEEGGVDQAVRFTCTIRVTGAITRTVAP